jgi:hypothetical protein
MRVMGRESARRTLVMHAHPTFLPIDEMLFVFGDVVADIVDEAQAS